MRPLRSRLRLAGCDADGLLAALGGLGETAAGYAASLSGRHGPRDADHPRTSGSGHVAFDPTAAGACGSSSCRPGPMGRPATPRQTWTPDPSSDVRARAAPARSRAGLAPARSLLTAAHRASPGCGSRSMPTCWSRAPGAERWEAVATSSTTALALVPARNAAGPASRRSPRVRATGPVRTEVPHHRRTPPAVGQAGQPAGGWRLAVPVGHSLCDHPRYSRAFTQRTPDRRPVLSEEQAPAGNPLCDRIYGGENPASWSPSVTRSPWRSRVGAASTRSCTRSLPYT